jgi:hypothetical protein
LVRPSLGLKGAPVVPQSGTQSRRTGLPELENSSYPVDVEVDR